MKRFLIINFVMFLALISCDAGVMSSRSSVEEQEQEGDPNPNPNPIEVVGSYKSKDEKYYVKITKDENGSSGYLLLFSYNNDGLKEPCSYEYDSYKKLFKFDIKEGRNPTKYSLLFEKEGYPILSDDKGHKIQLIPFIEELL